MTTATVSPLKWQQQVWSSGVRFQVISAGRRTGKTKYARDRLFVEAMSANPGEVMYVGLTQSNAKRNMFRPFLNEYREFVSSSNIKELEITLINGATIMMVGADNPNAIRGGSLKLAILDEYAFMKPEVWQDIVRPMLSDHKGAAIFIGTPMGRNHFWELSEWVQGTQPPNWGYWHFTSMDNETIDPAEIEQAKIDLSPEAFAREYMASFTEKDSELFKSEWVKYGDEPREGDWYVSIDLAGFSDQNRSKNLDETAIAIVKVTDGGDWFIHDVQHGRWTFDETVRRIFDAVREYRPIKVGIERGIAKQAVMSPLQDMMRFSNFFFTIQDLTHGNRNKVARIVNALQGRMEQGKVSLNESGDWRMKFLDQLFQMPSKLTHDDLVDAVAYVDQLVTLTYQPDYSYDTFEPLDAYAGF